MEELETLRFQRILVTYGCSNIGAHFVRYISDRFSVRLVDQVKWEADRLGNFPGESRIADLRDPEACADACRGIDTIIHLDVASPQELPLPQQTQISSNLLAAAQKARCKRFILVSSLQVVDAYPLDMQISPQMPPRPSSPQGAAQAFGEALAAYYAHNEGLPSVVLRLGHYAEPDEQLQLSPHEMSAYLHPDDCNQLLHKCIEAPNLTYEIAHGLSDNRFKRLDISDTRERFGYTPSADAFHIFGAKRT